MQRKKIKKYGELWSKVRDFIRSIIKNFETKNNYDKKYIKIRLNSDDELPLSKTIEIPSMVINVRAFISWKLQILSRSGLRWMSI